METKMMMIDSEEGLMTWCKTTESGIRLQRRGAKIIFDYLSGHGKTLSTNKEGELFINDEVMTEKTTLDDVVDLVCEWNYEALSDTRERKENPNDFLDYCRMCTLEKNLEEHKFILDRVFKQTIYGKDVQTIAHKLAKEMMKEMRLVPIYDIPITDELGAYNKVSEKSEYMNDDRVSELEEIAVEDNVPKSFENEVEDNEPEKSEYIEKTENDIVKAADTPTEDNRDNRDRIPEKSEEHGRAR